MPLTPHSSYTLTNTVKLAASPSNPSSLTATLNFVVRNHSELTMRISGSSSQAQILAFTKDGEFIFFYLYSFKLNISNLSIAGEKVSLLMLPFSIRAAMKMQTNVCGKLHGTSCSMTCQLKFSCTLLDTIVIVLFCVSHENLCLDNIH